MNRLSIVLFPSFYLQDLETLIRAACVCISKDIGLTVKIETFYASTIVSLFN